MTATGLRRPGDPGGSPSKTSPLAARRGGGRFRSKVSRAMSARSKSSGSARFEDLSRRGGGSRAGTITEGTALPGPPGSGSSRRNSRTTGPASRRRPRTPASPSGGGRAPIRRSARRVRPCENRRRFPPTTWEIGIGRPAARSRATPVRSTPRNFPMRSSVSVGRWVRSSYRTRKYRPDCARKTTDATKLVVSQSPASRRGDREGVRFPTPSPSGRARFDHRNERPSRTM